MGLGFVGTLNRTPWALMLLTTQYRPVSQAGLQGHGPKRRSASVGEIASLRCPLDTEAY